MFNDNYSAVANFIHWKSQELTSRTYFPLTKSL